MDIRPLDEADVPAAAAIGAVVFNPPGSPPPADEIDGAERRFAHLRATDPGGAWVAVDADGTVVGATLAIRREALWGLSFLGVLPGLQARGIGTRLLARALAHAEGARDRLIVSSTDPKAMRAYARAGLRLRPCVAAGGIVDPARLPPPAPAVVVSDDVAATAAVSRHVRGASHDRDIPVYLASGLTLLLHPGRGFAVTDGPKLKLLAARDPAAASELLWAFLRAAPPGATISVDFLAAEQDWAIAVVLEAGLALSPDGPLFVGGNPGPMTPYIPSGAFL